MFSASILSLRCHWTFIAHKPSKRCSSMHVDSMYRCIDFFVCPFSFILLFSFPYVPRGKKDGLTEDTDSRYCWFQHSTPLRVYHVISVMSMTVFAFTCELFQSLVPYGMVCLFPFSGLPTLPLERLTRCCAVVSFTQEESGQVTVRMTVYGIWRFSTFWLLTSLALSRIVVSSVTFLINPNPGSWAFVLLTIPHFHFTIRFSLSLCRVLYVLQYSWLHTTYRRFWKCCVCHVRYRYMHM